LGAKATHVMPTDALRTTFVLLLYLLGTRMLIGLF
jgi:uncharacterized membrane protein YfcA